MSWLDPRAIPAPTNDGEINDAELRALEVQSLCNPTLIALKPASTAEAGETIPAADALLLRKMTLLDATLENMDQGLIVVDAEGIIKVCNRRAMVLLDVPAAFMLSGPSLDELVRFQMERNEFGPSTEGMHRWSASGGYAGRVYSYERERPNGTVLEIRTVPQSDGGAIRTYTDITHRKRAEIALQESDTRMRALADGLPQMVWVARAGDGSVTYVNQRFRDYFGEIGQTRSDRIAAHHPEDRQRAAATWASAEASGQTCEIEARWRRRDGAYRWHKLILAPVRQADRITEWLGTALDIDDIVAAREALREKTDLLQLAQEAAGAGLFEWNMVDGSHRLSSESLRMFGLPQDQPHHIDPQPIWKAIHPEDVAVMREATQRAIETGTTYRAEFRVPHPDGTACWVQGIGRIVRDASGQPVRMVGLNIDISERKAFEETLRVNEERLALALESGSDGLWDWQIETGEVWYSDRWQIMLGYTPGELEGHNRTWLKLIHPDDRDRAMAITKAHFEGRTPSYECEHRLRRRDGGWTWVLSRGKVVRRSDDGRPLRAVGTHIDVNARKTAESQIAHMARHDAVTDLPNRILFRERLDQRLAEISRYGGTCAVLSLDLDRFKAVNDTSGHFAGDAVLREVARRLKIVLRVEDTVARLGSDEFAVLVAHAGSADDVRLLAQRLIATTGVAVMVGEHQFEVGLCVGVVLAPEHGGDGETVLKRADLALYRAQADGPNTTCFFATAMDEEATSRRRLERDLRVAIAQDGLTLHYQPQVRGDTGELVGFEALVRWQHPDCGLVMPSSFITLAEESGLIVSLGEWVLRSACREAASWSSPLKIAVNLSPRQFQQIDLPEIVLGILNETGLSPHRLELEITETVIINDMVRALAILRRLKALGVGIAMDDFGTGYSSLATLQSFPFDKIKIDRMFVGQLIENPQSEAIVRAVLGLGRSLGMGVVAEGVETLEQERFLCLESCDELQGYLLGKPQPIAQFADAIKTRRLGGMPTSDRPVAAAE